MSDKPTLTVEECQAILDYIETLEAIYENQVGRKPQRTTCEREALMKIHRSSRMVEAQQAVASGFNPDDDPDLLENIDRFNRI